MTHKMTDTEIVDWLLSTLKNGFPIDRDRTQYINIIEEVREKEAER